MTEKIPPPENDGARPASPEAVLQSLTVALTQINHNYDSDAGLLPVHLLLPMEKARPGTVAEYAETLLEEPRHRRSLDHHANVRAYLMLAGNYGLVFCLLGATVWLANKGIETGAIATAVLAFTQILGSLFKAKSDPAPQMTAARNEATGRKKPKK